MAEVEGSLEQLRRFVHQVERSPTLQQMVMNCRSPEEIITIAEKIGCPFTRGRLRRESRWLAASYWPWADRGRPVRVGFFSTPQPGEG